MKYPAYPDYKDSPIPWLPRIPSNWEVHRLKWAVTSCDNGVWGDEPDGGPDDVACIRVADFDRLRFSVSADKLTMRSIDARQRASRLVRKGDLLIEKSGGGEKQLVGCVVRFDHEFPAVCSNFVARMGVADGQSSRYWTYAHAALYAGRLNDPAIKQTTGIQNLDAGEYLNNLFAYAPPEEQEKITDFLDWRTAQIDALIAKKQALLERLSEKRSTLITRAVTCGMQPNVELHETGSPWTPNIPAHWMFMKFGHCTSIAEGQVNPEEEPFCDLPLVAPNHIEAHTGRLLEVTSAQEQGAISGKYLVRAGDLVYSKIRPHLNKCALVDFDALCSADAYPIRTDDLLLPQFLKLWMLARPFLDFATESSMRVAMPKINRETLNAGPLAVPPIDEQAAIVAFIEAETNAIDLLANKAEMALKKLFEYRSALITAAVTGQIDVRGVQVPAPV